MIYLSILQLPACFAITATCAMSFWVPTLLLAFGFGVADVPLGAAALGLGGVVAVMLLVPLAAGWGVRRTLVPTTHGATALIALLARCLRAHRLDPGTGRGRRTVVGRAFTLARPA